MFRFKFYDFQSGGTNCAEMSLSRPNLTPFSAPMNRKRDMKPSEKFCRGQLDSSTGDFDPNHSFTKPEQVFSIWFFFFLLMCSLVVGPLNRLSHVHNSCSEWNYRHRNWLFPWLVVFLNCDFYGHERSRQRKCKFLCTLNFHFIEGESWRFLRVLPYLLQLCLIRSIPH